MKIADLFENTSLDLLGLSPYEFDQDQTGWRGLTDERQQISIILRYLTCWAASPNTWKAGTPKDLTHRTILPAIIMFHCAQIYAFLGLTKNAVDLLQKACETQDIQWNSYVQCTKAFLKQDKAAFCDNATLPNYNSNIINRMKRNWGQPYANAYDS